MLKGELRPFTQDASCSVFLFSDRDAGNIQRDINLVPTCSDSCKLEETSDTLSGKMWNPVNLGRSLRCDLSYVWFSCRVRLQSEEKLFTKKTPSLPRVMFSRIPSLRLRVTAREARSCSDHFPQPTPCGGGSRRAGLLPSTRGTRAPPLPLTAAEMQTTGDVPEGG